MDNQMHKASDMPRKAKITLPVVALGLDFAPVLFLFLASLHEIFLLLLLVSVFLPVVGILVGIIALCKGKSRIGTKGIVLSIIAIALPIIFVFTVVLLFRTGAIVFGM